MQSGDEVFCLAATRHIRQVMRELRKLENPIRRIMIAGGGNIGYRLARSIEDRYEVKVLEHERRRTDFLALNLTKTLVLQGDATDEELLEAKTSKTWTCSSRSPTTRKTTSWPPRWPSLNGRPPHPRADQPQELCRPGAGRADRHRHLACPGLDRHPAGACAPRRRGGGAQPAPRRRRSLELVAHGDRATSRSSAARSRRSNYHAASPSVRWSARPASIA